jgi:cyanophycinase
MLQLKSQLFNGSMPRLIKTAVMAIGGAEDRVRARQILQTFFSRAGSTNARIAVIPSASRQPEVMGRIYRDIFEDMGAKLVEVLNVEDREQGEDPLLQAYLEDCTGVFISGGDQLRLCGLLADTPLMEKLRSQVQQGQITLAGTSAGAAVIGHHMIAGGGSGESPSRSSVDMAVGLGIIPEVIVDQHFHNRNRMVRLISAIATYPSKLGIGIDEDTCAVFEADGSIRVIGKGTVTIVDPGEVTYTNQPNVEGSEPISIHNLRLHILSHGDRYDLRRCQAMLPLQADDFLGW